MLYIKSYDAYQLFGHNSGILSLFLPKPQKIFSWASGKSKTIDDNLLVSIGASPEFAVKSQKLEPSARITSNVKTKLLHCNTLKLIHENYTCVDANQNFIVYAAATKVNVSPPCIVACHVMSNSFTRFPLSHTSAVTCVKIVEIHNDEGKSWRVISGAYDHTSCVWNLLTGELLAVLKGNNDSTVWCVDVSRDGKYAVTGSDDNVSNTSKQ